MVNPLLYLFLLGAEHPARQQRSQTTTTPHCYYNPPHSSLLYCMSFLQRWSRAKFLDRITTTGSHLRIRTTITSISLYSMLQSFPTSHTSCCIHLRCASSVHVFILDLHVWFQVEPRCQLLAEGCIALQHRGKHTQVSAPRSKDKDMHICTWPKWCAFHQKPTKTNTWDQ